jgi:DUF917 family protein
MNADTIVSAAITADDIEDLALGAAVLGAGGGGDPWLGAVALAEALRRYGPLPLVRPDELDPDGLVLTVGAVGDPGAMLEQLPNGAEVAEVVEHAQRQLGRTAVALLPLQVGGGTSLLPLAAVAATGLPCVDADTTGRALPRLTMNVLTLAGIPAAPLVLADAGGAVVLLQTADSALAEQLAGCCVERLGLAALVLAHPLSGRQCARYALAGAVSHCVQIGHRVRAIGHGAALALAEFLRFCRAETVFTGMVTTLDRRTRRGGPATTVVLEGDDGERAMRVEAQETNLVATEDGLPVVTVPDLVTFLDTATGTPVPTEALGCGQHVHVVGLPAAARWRSADGVALAGPAAFGYDVDHVPLGSRP